MVAKQMFKKLNEKYDNLGDTPRFLVFLALISPGIISIMISDFTEIRGFATFGILYLSVILIPRIVGRY